ncbi:SsrA-binding protein SmpB [Rickettsiales endosymbiont of Peranema trichophorum]|uniref:SsrA-binding protein SmpB n=1 Tax=Rickettsiales endosymbiont of Peranema trichophorum TaxID=2486577 RepID=UPI001022D0DA|nr:SsrA-binding protein SmpB [Rickettsiales endosymbiont of Peranema trichophorum]RZI46001.1 SsrA-binding protein SmpB [Rickettsiales endosymbiont of Peranema trichophorum]
MTKYRVVAENRRAHYDFFIEEKHEAGIVLTGTEVKSLRKGQASILESHVGVEGSEMFLYGAHIPEYDKAYRFNHYSRRTRKLLLHKREIKKLAGLIQRKGYTIVPLQIYFNNRNKAKVLLALAKGKKQHDKRETIKQREWTRHKARVLKEETC